MEGPLRPVLALATLVIFFLGGGILKCYTTFKDRPNKHPPLAALVPSTSLLKCLAFPEILALYSSLTLLKIFASPVMLEDINWWS